MATFTLTCIGDDRPGLVSALSGPINAHGGSWERSQMARLGGKFAGVLLVEVADENADALVADLTALQDVGLHVTLERTDQPPEHPSVRLGLDLLGAQHIGIEELTTAVRDAPMAGGTLFEARAVLEAPPAVSLDQLRTMLEAIADELMVELHLSDADLTD
jgi:glycine cleavage system regulatory protein